MRNDVHGESRGPQHRVDRKRVRGGGWRGYLQASRRALLRTGGRRSAAPTGVSRGGPVERNRATHPLLDPVLGRSVNVQRATRPSAAEAPAPAVRHRPGGAGRVARPHDGGGRLAGSGSGSAEGARRLLRDRFDRDDQPAGSALTGAAALLAAEAPLGSGLTRSWVTGGAASTSIAKVCPDALARRSAARRRGISTRNGCSTQSNAITRSLTSQKRPFCMASMRSSDASTNSVRG